VYPANDRLPRPWRRHLFVDERVLMQRVHFCSGSVFLTGDAIAISLLQYVRAVGTLDRSDVLTVPVVSPSGRPGTITLLLNEAVQISAESVETEIPELLDGSFVGRVEGLTAELLQPGVWDGMDSLIH
jgi:hypothetical protein